MMKKILYSTIFVLFSLVTLESFRSLDMMKKDGAAPGYTGSPGDSLKNCTACHFGAAVNVNGWITSNIPPTGYIPNQTYTITAFNKEYGATRFGFEVSPQDITGLLLGKMVVTDPVRTKFTGSDKYITYTENGVESVDSSSWSFNWIAPAAGTGAVTFYGGFNSNFDGHKDVDKTYLSTLSVKEGGTSSINPSPKVNSGLITYPNPADNILNLHFEVKATSEILVELFDISGKKVAVIMNEKQNGLVKKEFNTTNIPDGIYLIRFNTDGNSVVRQIYIAH